MVPMFTCGLSLLKASFAIIVNFNYNEFSILLIVVEPVMGIEPMASSLPRKRSTSELHWLTSRAEDEIRTRDPQLGRLMLYRLSYFRNKKTWGEQDSNLRRHKPADLQSAPVGHFGISPRFNLFKKTKSRWRDSNPRPADYKSAALAS